MTEWQQGRGVPAAVAGILAVAADPEAEPPAILDALVVLRGVQESLAALEPDLIAAARRAGVSWQALAPALGVASRQAAERRYLRSAAATRRHGGDAHDTRDGRVRAERDHRAVVRAIARWANDNTADLRRLAGQLTAIDDLPDAAPDLERLHRALGDPDATALPALLTAMRVHLDRPELAHLAVQIDEVTAHTTEVSRQTQQDRAESRPTPAQREPTTL